MNKTVASIFQNELTLKCDKWDLYLEVYEQYFRKFVDTSPTLVEVGIQGGGSLQLWRKYFGPDAKIHGIDIDPSVLRHHVNYDNLIKMYIGNQGDINFWKEFAVQVPQIDIFIDDGSHAMHDQITTFECVFPMMKVGGVYICEDNHTSYMPWMGAGLRKPGTFIEYMKNVVDGLHAEHFQPNNKVLASMRAIKGLRSVHFYNSMVVCLKDKEHTLKRLVVNEQ
jgi:hypothetical protein